MIEEPVTITVSAKTRDTLLNQKLKFRKKYKSMDDVIKDMLDSEELMLFIAEKNEEGVLPAAQ